MKKWLKRLSFAALCGLIMLSVIAGGSYYQLQGEPEWHKRPPLTEEMRNEAMSRAQTQFSRVEDLASSLRAYEDRRQKAIRSGTTLPNDELPKPVTVLLTEDELNAVFQTFAKARGWDNDLKDYVTGLTLILQGNQLIFGGKLTDLQILTSAYFTPSIDSDGQLHLDLTNVLGGKLPLPDILLAGYRQKVVTSLERRLPPLQQSAGFDSHGVPTNNMVQASLTKLLLQSLQHQSSDAVLFLPVLTRSGTVPVRLTGIAISDRQLEITLAPMDESQRKEMLAKLRAPYQTLAAQ